MFFIEQVERGIRLLREPVHHEARLGIVYLLLERSRFVERCESALHGVDEIVLDSRKLFFARFYSVHRCAAHLRTRALCQKLNALRRRICALIELSGQILYAEDMPLRLRHFFEIYGIGRGRGKHHRHGRVKLLVGKTVHVVAYKRTRFCGNAERFRKLARKSVVRSFSFGK